MRDLQEYAIICKNELNKIGIRYGNVVEFSINTRAKHRWGQCRKLPNGNYTINISSLLLDEEVCPSDLGLKNTLIHELLHTCKDCHGHKGKWKELANKVNRHYNYGISRGASAEEKGIDSSKIPQEKPTLKESKPKEYNYKISCISCNKTYLRQKMSKVIQHPEFYRCGVCGGKLQRIF